MCRTHYAHAYLDIVKNSFKILNTEYCHECVYVSGHSMYVYGHEYEFQIPFCQYGIPFIRFLEMDVPPNIVTIYVIEIDFVNIFAGN